MFRSTTSDRDVRSPIHRRLAGLLLPAATALLLATQVAATCAERDTAEQTGAFPGSRDVWHGYTRYQFPLDDRSCYVVVPRQAAEGKPWVWRARFFGHQPGADLALLEKGFHVAYIDVAGLFGSPRAVRHWDAFYHYLTAEHGFSARPALEGMSRGGLIVLNWAAANPEKTACIYVDAPVCDFKSWPGGKGRGRGSPRDWQACLKAYGMTEAEALKYQGNPVDRLQPLARAGVPILSICGDADEVVPLEENTRIMEDRYRKLGGRIKVIVKPGVGHHPHSLKDPAPIVEFVLEHTLR